MGCDIHVFIEAKKYDGCGWWSFANDVKVDRSYRVFSAMADCGRGEEIPIIPNRGIPLDADWNAKRFIKHWEDDGHSHSWLTFKEMKTREDIFRGEFFYEAMRILAEKYGEDSVRLIFFFDN